jgi:ABC-type sugar transport system substrate-binding protein
VAERLLKKGVGWITLNHGREALLMRLREEFPGLPVALVAIDNEEFGRTQGRQLRRLLPKGGTALSVRGNPFDSACRDRSRGMKAELQGSAITIEEVDARWDADTAEKVVHKWISSPLRRQTALHAIVCQNDSMGVASRKALARGADELTRPELKRLPVLGGDGLAHLGRRWVDEGTLTATVCVTLPGKPAVEQLARYWRNGSALAPVTRLGVRSYPSLNALSPVVS